MSDKITALNKTAFAALSCHMAPAISFRASAQDGEDLPRRIKFLNWGENKGRTTGARVIVNERTLKSLAANQEAFACDIVELDYEHQSVKSHPNYKEDPRHSAAHGSVEVIEGEGVYLNVQDYTPNGLEHAASYQDVSGVARVDAKTGELLLVSSVALTQRGDVAGMEFSDHVVALSSTDPLSNKPQDTNPNTPKSTMDDTEKKDKYRMLLISLLGLEPEEGETEISDEAIAGAAANFSEEKAMSAKDDAASEKEKDDVIISLTARLDNVETNQAIAQKAALVANATAQGKQIPLSAEDIEQLPLKVLTAMIDRLEPGQVPTQSQVATEKPAGEVALSADDKAIAALLDLTEEEYKAGQV